MSVPDDAWAIIPNSVTGYRIENGAIRRTYSRDASENIPAGGVVIFNRKDSVPIFNFRFAI